MVGLSHLEHLKSVRPSFLISTYLLVTILLDAARLRTEWLRANAVPFTDVSTASFITKIALLGLETVEKRRLLRQDEKDLSVEITSGPFSRGFFVWLLGLLRTGFTTLLSVESLPSIYEKLSSDKVYMRFEQAWSRCEILAIGMSEARY